jgi:hypothetical protein
MATDYVSYFRNSNPALYAEIQEYAESHGKTVKEIMDAVFMDFLGSSIIARQEFLGKIDAAIKEAKRLSVEYMMGITPNATDESRTFFEYEVEDKPPLWTNHFPKDLIP